MKDNSEENEKVMRANEEIYGIYPTYSPWPSWGSEAYSWNSGTVRYKKIHPDAVEPVYANPKDACVDLYAVEDAEINYGETTLVKTGLILEIPDGYEGIIRPRSSLSKKGVDVNLGTIDSGYRGEIMVSMTKKWWRDGVPQAGDPVFVISLPYYVKKGDKIAQLAIRKTHNFIFVESEELSETERGEGGFGSSGK